MKSHLMIATVALAAALLAGPATTPSYAADMPMMRKAAPMMPVDPWAGFYAGVIGGYGWASSSHDAANGQTSGSFNQSGWLAGGVVGYNWHTGPVVLGVEFDASAADIDGATSGLVTCTGLCETKVGWLYTGRARLGLPFGSVMPYVTAGGAVAGLRMAESNSISAATPHVWGWTAGGGIEFMPLPQWSFRAEFLHADFGNGVDANDLFGAFTPGFPPVTVKERNLNMVRAGLTFYFGADRYITETMPVSSKY
jgi:outer membrane immunogenic protein